MTKASAAVRERICATLQAHGPLTMAEIADAVGRAYNGIGAHLGVLIAEGRVVVVTPVQRQGPRTVAATYGVP